MAFNQNSRAGQRVLYDALIAKLAAEIGERQQCVKINDSPSKQTLIKIQRKILDHSFMGPSYHLDPKEVRERYHNLLILRLHDADNQSILPGKQREITDLLKVALPKLSARQGRVHLWHQEMAREVAIHEGNINRIKSNEPDRWAKVVDLADHPENHDETKIPHVMTALYFSLHSWITQEMTENPSRYQDFEEEFNNLVHIKYGDEVIIVLTAAEFLAAFFTDSYSHIDTKVKEDYRRLGTNKQEMLDHIIRDYKAIKKAKEDQDKVSANALKKLANLDAFDPVYSNSYKIFLSAMNDENLQLRDKIYHKSFVACFTTDLESINKIDKEDWQFPELNTSSKNFITMLAAAFVTADRVPQHQTTLQARFDMCINLLKGNTLTLENQRYINVYFSKNCLFHHSGLNFRDPRAKNETRKRPRDDHPSLSPVNDPEKQRTGKERNKKSKAQAETASEAGPSNQQQPRASPRVPQSGAASHHPRPPYPQYHRGRGRGRGFFYPPYPPPPQGKWVFQQK